MIVYLLASYLMIGVGVFIGWFVVNEESNLTTHLPEIAFGLLFMALSWPFTVYLSYHAVRELADSRRKDENRNRR